MRDLQFLLTIVSSNFVSSFVPIAQVPSLHINDALYIASAYESRSVTTDAETNDGAKQQQWLVQWR